MPEQQLHSDDFKVIDAHCDALLAVIGKSQIPNDNGKRDFLVDNPMSHVDLPKLKRGRVACQFMALFAEDEDVTRAKEYTHSLIDSFEDICERSEATFFKVLSGDDLDKAVPGEKVGALLSIEGAEALEGELSALDSFYSRGVRAMGITWNRRNPFGRGVKAEGQDGLSALGKNLVEKMEELGMIVDSSHLSDTAFFDLADMARRPFIASHSNAREVCNHPRNLTDEMIRSIADSGGAIGVVFVPSFIVGRPGKSYLEHLCDHIDRIVMIGGIECAAIGSDFDGYRGVEGHVLRNSSEFSILRTALLDRDYDKNHVEKILYGNWNRVIKELLQ
jgi:membrane dipeptidase